MFKGFYGLIILLLILGIGYFVFVPQALAVTCAPGYCGPDPSNPTIKHQQGLSCSVQFGNCSVVYGPTSTYNCNPSSCEYQPGINEWSCENNACVSKPINLECCVLGSPPDPGGGGGGGGGGGNNNCSSCETPANCAAIGGVFVGGPECGNPGDGKGNCTGLACGGGGPPEPGSCSGSGAACTNDASCCQGNQGCFPTDPTDIYSGFTCQDCGTPAVVLEKCGANPSCGRSYICHGTRYYCPSTSCTLSATLSASPDNGQAPLNSVSLTANSVSNQPFGYYNYTFRCGNGPGGGPGTTRVYVNRGVSFTAPNICSYAVAGVYTPTVRVSHSGFIGNVGASTTVTVVAPYTSAWWQAKDSDVISMGSVMSRIPSTCVAPTCNPYLILDGLGGFPGIVVYNSVYDFSADSQTSGIASSKNWLVNTTYVGKLYDYNYFKSIVPSSVVPDIINQSTLTNGYLNAQGTLQGGYYWYKHTGNLTINTNVNLPPNRKTVLYVESGNLTIQGDITITGGGAGFFAAIVGGDITLDPAVATLNGLYLSDGTFTTGTGTKQLTVSGSVAALSGFNLQRDLGGVNGVNNNLSPAEIFTYDPIYTFTAPQSFSKPNIQWTEVAP